MGSTLTETAPTRATATVALVGNPNTGKTTLFNALTGMSQQVGNFPGVTVERKVGRMRLGDRRWIDVLDLPGTYSLAAHSPDEVIAVDALLGHLAGAPPIDVVVAIVDATNLRRNLYLVTQLLEAELPVVVALNMMDMATAQGIRIDARVLSSRLGVPVIPISAHRRQGLDELRSAVVAAAIEGRSAPVPSPTPFPKSFLDQVDSLRTWRPPSSAAPPPNLSRFEALRALVDESGHLERRLTDRLGEAFAAELRERRSRARDGHDEVPLSALESTIRYAWIDELLRSCIEHRPRNKDAGVLMDRIDWVLTHRVLGLAAFVVISTVMFQAIYSWAGPLMDAIQAGLQVLCSSVSDLMPAGALRSLVVDGVLGGVGAVLVFLPQIAILFFFISVLEDSGYMARAALLMDRLLTSCGLSGKSFIPLLSSFACAVPGILSTRTIEDSRDRLTTMLVAPLMSCSARLPIYTVFIAAFVPRRPLLGPYLTMQAGTLLAMYVLGIVLAIPIAFLLKKLVLRGAPAPFLMELPAYRWPSWRSVGMRVYVNSRAFVVRAGSVIMATTLVMWALAYFPRPEHLLEIQAQQRRELTRRGLPRDQLQASLSVLQRRQSAQLLEQSYLGRAGHLLAPVVRPLGWDWRIGMATVASFPAREVVISSLGAIFSLGGDDDQGSDQLGRALQRARRPDGTPLFTLAVALSVMVFFALCAQCMSTLVTIQRESGSWRWAALTFAYMSVLAYLGAFIAYHGARAMGWG